MKRISYVIFDFGGVIGLPQCEQYVKEMVSLTGVERTILMSNYTKYRKEYDQGLIDTKTYWSLILQDVAVNLTDELLDKLRIADAASWCQINEMTVEYILQLKAKGIRIALLSNINTGVVPYIEERFDWLKAFNERFYSCDFNLLKPSPEMYQYVMNKLNVDASECLFIDDLKDNVEGAKKVGMEAIQFDDFDSLKTLIDLKYQLVAKLPRSTPESLGIPSGAIERFLDVLSDAKLEMHSFMIVRKGHVAAEGWWAPYRQELRHQLFSLSKSFTSTAIGFAVKEGRLSILDKVISFFEKEMPDEISENLRKMTIRDLLTMSSGHDFDTIGPMTEASDPDWVKNFLALPVEHEPGTHFLYNTGATYMLSAILQKVAGCTLFDYLKPRLFDPLGFEDTTWDRCPMGRNVGGWGLNLHTEDIAKFGLFLLNKGMWMDKQLIAAQWIDEATAKQINNGDEGDNEWSHGYGYQFWRCRHNTYRGDGAFGQYCIVIPDHDVVIAITSAVDDMQIALNAVWSELLPNFSYKEETQQERAHNEKAHQALLHRLSTLVILPPSIDSTMELICSTEFEPQPINTYEMEKNELDIQTLSFDFNKSLISIGIKRYKHPVILQFNKDTWYLGQMKLFELPLMQGITYYAASGVWDVDEFVLTIRLIETPVYETWRCSFEQKGLLIKRCVNVSFGPKERQDLVGRKNA